MAALGGKKQSLQPFSTSASIMMYTEKKPPAAVRMNYLRSIYGTGETLPSIDNAALI